MRHICEGCKDKFNEKSALLRHISHRKSCKTHYGEIRFKQMRTEGKLVAKRKWWQNHAKEKIKSDFTKTKKSPKVLHKIQLHLQSSFDRKTVPKMTSGALLEASWRPLGTSWAPLGPLLGPSRALLGAS